MSWGSRPSPPFPWGEAGGALSAAQRAREDPRHHVPGKLHGDLPCLLGASFPFQVPQGQPGARHWLREQSRPGL